MKIIGITGGVGAGKTQILSFLEVEYKAVILVTDRIAEQLMEPGTDCLAQIKMRFPEEVFKQNGSIDRPQMAALIFKKPEYRMLLNQLVHPAVKEFVLKRVEEEKEKKTALVVIEAALLLEEHYDAFCDEVWYIDTEKEVRRKRLLDSRGYSKEKIDKMMKAQLTDDEFRKSADVVISNNGTIEETNQQIRSILKDEGEDSNGRSKRQ